MDKRKDEIIEIAIRRFSHYGFAKTTMNEIADDVGITKANLYYYYPDKTELIKDVILSTSNQLIKEEKKLIEEYNGDFLGTLFAVLELRAVHMRKYYMLYINENLDWLKGDAIACFIKDVEHEDFKLLFDLVSKSVNDGVLKLTDIEDSCRTFLDIIKGVTLTHTLRDIIRGIPNKDNVDSILENQKKAAKLIFEERIVINI